MATQAASEISRQNALLATYRPVPGVHDEMLAADGSVRRHWQALVDLIGQAKPAEVNRRFSRANRYLADAGVFYRLYRDAGAEREWPLSHPPLILDAAEWQGLEAGLIQRAELLEALCTDIYGDNQMVAEGLLPPSLIASNPEFLRPMVGHPPASGHFLHFIGFELGRDADGRWRVLGDRTQAPSGSGFALENRVATSRAFGDIQGAMNVPRLAGFFRDFRDHLMQLRRHPDEAIAVISPGPLNDTYFEHAYLARYLGFPLLEGEDLTVSDGRVMLRTVAGLKPAGVLWRRVDAGFMDPLELLPQSRIGTPGLAGALRNGAATSINALGTGILETRALQALLPRLARRLIGDSLSLPSLDTFWCGERDGARAAAERFDVLQIGPALSTRLAIEDDDTRPAKLLDATQRTAVLDRIAQGDGSLVAQETVALSTVPVDIDGQFHPRPVVLRAFAARTAQGWTIMPGGFARIGRGASAITIQRGGRVADVWIVGEERVKPISLMAQDAGALSTMPGSLPSRTADNLFWLGRYVERAEDTLRILRAYNSRLTDSPGDRGGVLSETRSYLRKLGVDAGEPVPSSLVATITDVEGTAGRIRDRLSPDGWLALRDLSKTVRQLADRIQPGDDAVRAMTILLRKLTGFSGLVHENMYRSTGWRFLEIGRRIERALQTARLVASLTRKGAPDGALDLLLEVGDSVMTHRRRFGMNAGSLSHIELLALDPDNPRSILFQLAEMKSQIEHLPSAAANPERSPLRLEALRLHAGLAVLQPRAVEEAVLSRLGGDLGNLSDLVSAAYFR